jgi:hypothetical protein
MAIENASLPAQPIPQLVRLTACPVAWLFTLGSVDQLVAMAARIDFAAVQQSHAPPNSHVR